ncbi:hypothetical protein ASPWEDRAFT_182027 [Aspergillus wentii DTO 134E9]|uniref:Uncharacterized protein n=1 Tax=Aspergillus wentii DTO 134E9 TaxID=1073089 RepID=A0A1L9RQ88_ASPWE|nr:uncharacterized protein ASPWEDRAFT_182027 [Aspergillus wentii DTO 134E9]OJJ37130.1 hypothetical protein ASPWEDRAFT_182027 [Aspergillus wentii DTO 134E9]
MDGQNVQNAQADQYTQPSQPDQNAQNDQTEKEQLDINDKLLESIDARRKQTRSKGMLAKSLLSLQKNLAGDAPVPPVLDKEDDQGPAGLVGEIESAGQVEEVESEEPAGEVEQNEQIEQDKEAKQDEEAEHGEQADQNDQVQQDEEVRPVESIQQAEHVERAEQADETQQTEQAEHTEQNDQVEQIKQDEPAEIVEPADENPMALVLYSGKRQTPIEPSFNDNSMSIPNVFDEVLDVPSLEFEADFFRILDTENTTQPLFDLSNETFGSLPLDFTQLSMPEFNGESALQPFPNIPDEVTDAVLPITIDEPAETQTAGSFTQTSGLDWTNDLTMVEEDTSKFHAVEAWYQGLKEPTLADTIRYQAAVQEEEAREKRLESREALKEHESGSTDDEALFCSDEESEMPPHEGPSNGDPGPSSSIGHNKPKSKPRERKNRISAEEKRRSRQVGLDIALGRVQKKEPGNTRKRKANNTGPNPGQNAGGKGNRKKQKTTGQDVYLDGLFAHGIVEDAAANASLPAIPSLAGRNKDKALAELIASIPNADQDVKDDKNKVLAATRRFTHSAKSDDQGGWKIKGLRTTLYHHQLLGAAFMRDRENSSQGPFGGLLCDIMGFGKTLQALANVVDGKPSDPDDPVKTTLIVVPSHLVSHWRDQVLRHCDVSAIGRVLEYHARARLSSLDIVGTIQLHDVVITTYEEVRRSYPKIEFSGNMNKSEKEITELWEQAYEEEVGPLHKIKFLRIILDEGHLIRNISSSTSIAVRALTGKYKWILTGTPLINWVRELYTYFQFLEVPRIGQYHDFKQNYYNPGDGQSHQRLVNLLRSILTRRTHSSRLFSLPIIKLPDLSERTITVNFCDVERKIYTLIELGGIAEVNGLVGLNDRIAQIECFLVMILRLRMFSSHLLTAQFSVKKLLTDEVMGEITALSNQKDTEHPSYKIATWLAALRNSLPIPPKPATSGGTMQAQPDESAQLDEYLTGDREELIRKFRAFMCELHGEENWVERLDRGNCPSCGYLGEASVITSCMHLYCEECYYILKESTAPEDGKPICMRCNVTIQEAARYGTVDNSNVEESLPDPPTQTTQKKGGKSKKPKQSKKAGMAKYGMFSDESQTQQKDNNKPENKEGDKKGDDEVDWDKTNVALHMPGTKLTQTEKLIAGWIRKNKSVKVVIFTQFLGSVRVLSGMCYRRGWKHTMLTGKMPMQCRDENMQEFRDKSDVRILIASLRAGGTGLDMSMANKCILIDLWWNEAIQEQAFSRIYRIGQQREVEFVKIVIRNSVDDRIMKLQRQKTKEINGTIGEGVLEGRETIMELIKMFGTVQEHAGGGFIIIPNAKDD